MDDIIKGILKNIKTVEQDAILFETDNNTSIPINKDNFQKLPENKSSKKICFIDGGNLEIIKSPSLSLFFNRIYYTIYQNNKRIQNKTFEFYTLITTLNKEDRIFYRTEYFFTKNAISIKNYEFDSFDNTLTMGNTRASISIIGNVIRRFVELSIANEISDVDFIILDGSLETKYTYENEIMKKISKNVCGLSKTTTLLTKNGNSVNAYLTKLTNMKKWCYNVNLRLYFIKLHEKSKHIFRFETFDNDINEILSLLQENSRDPIFLGYPYGLIEADKFARVSKKEKGILQLQLMTRLKKNFGDLEPFLTSLNAHEILDNIG